MKRYSLLTLFALAFLLLGNGPVLAEKKSHPTSWSEKYTMFMNGEKVVRFEYKIHKTDNKKAPWTASVRAVSLSEKQGRGQINFHYVCRDNRFMTPVAVHFAGSLQSSKTLTSYLFAGRVIDGHLEGQMSKLQVSLKPGGKESHSSKDIKTKLTKTTVFAPLNFIFPSHLPFKKTDSSTYDLYDPVQNNTDKGYTLEYTGVKTVKIYDETHKLHTFRENGGQGGIYYLDNRHRLVQYSADKGVVKIIRTNLIPTKHSKYKKQILAVMKKMRKAVQDKDEAAFKTCFLPGKYNEKHGQVAPSRMYPVLVKRNVWIEVKAKDIVFYGKGAVAAGSLVMETNSRRRSKRGAVVFYRHGKSWHILGLTSGSKGKPLLQRYERNETGGSGGESSPPSPPREDRSDKRRSQ